MINTNMSVNTIRVHRETPRTRGVVGPQSGADPEARLRRLLMMGTQERERAIRPSARPTGAALCLDAQQHPSVATGMVIEVADTHLNPPHVFQLNPTDEDGYRGVVFSSRHCDYRFFVYRCSPQLSRRQIAYMVLARPADDPRVYTFK